MEAIRGIIHDELLQVFVTGLIGLSLLAVNVVVDDYLAAILSGTGGSGTMLQAANDRLAALGILTSGVLNNFGSVSIEIGKEASKGVFCNFLGVGFTIVNCSPFNAFRGSLTAAAFASSVALTDTYAQQFILSLAKNFAFQFIIPIGIFLRCFKTSRMAGGALIAFGFGFYAVYPSVIMVTDNLFHNPPFPIAQAIAGPLATPGVGACDPMEPELGVSLGQFRNYGNYLTTFDNVETVAYFVLVRVLFMSILNLIITLGFIRAFAHIIGSEIDVSALARIS